MVRLEAGLMETQELRLALLERGRGRCECGGESGYQCPHPAQELDHFFGRARQEELLETCWILSRSCHTAKTENRPSAKEWFRRFMRFTNRNAVMSESFEELGRWLAAHKRAGDRLEWILARESKF